LIPENLKKVYLIFYNLCQFVGFMYITTVMTVRYFKDGPSKYILSLKTILFHCNNEDRHAQILALSLHLEFWGGCWIFEKFVHASFSIRTVSSFFLLSVPYLPSPFYLY